VSWILPIIPALPSAVEAFGAAGHAIVVP